MTKYYISADLEGVCGVASPLQCYPKDDLTGYTMAVKQMALEVNTVAEAIFAHNPDAEVLVNDAHSTMTNLAQEMLSSRVHLLSGKPKLCAMMTGLDDSYRGAILLGYHAKAGTEKGVLNHTFHHKLYDVQVNGQSLGEGGINALYAGLVHQVPVILASGDKAFCKEIKTLMPSLHTVETKAGITTTAAQCHAWDKVKEDYRVQAAEALKKSQQWGQNGSTLTLPEAPYTLTITFIDSLACDVVMTSPLYKRVDGTTVEMTADNFKTLYQGLQSAYTMLAYTHYME